MNSSNSMGDNHYGDDVNAIGSVSRSGRVRKKNSLLADYDSPDVIEKRGRKSNSASKSGNNAVSRSHGKSQSIRGRKSDGYYRNLGPSRSAPSFSSHGMHDSFDDDVPDIGAEEIIDEGLLDGEDEAIEIPRKLHHGKNNVRLKSQAQSTYMLEKSFAKQRKLAGVGHNSGLKIKATRKDKGSPRVTAYMLWAKEQRAIFAKKYPNLDFSTVSKKLSDLWATVPQNQKRMWKTKAAKIMRKKANGTENMKNSAGPSLTLVNKAMAPTLPRKGMKNTTPEEAYLPKRPPGRPPKKHVQFLNSVNSVAGPSPKLNSYNNHSPDISHFKVEPILKKKAASKISGLARGHKLSHVSSVVDIKREPYKFKVTGTNPLDIAAHLSLLGESMKKLGAKLQNQNLPDQSVNESLSSLLDSLLCSVGPILCLTRMVPELNCIPEDKMTSILDSVGYIMPGVVDYSNS